MGTRVSIIHKVEHLDPRSFYKEARSLHQVGYDVTMYVLSAGNRTVDGIKVIGFQRRRSRMARFLFTNAEIFWHAFRGGADVYHFHDLDFIPWALLLKAVTRGKIVYDIHEAHPEYMLLKGYIPRPLRRAVAWSVAIVEKLSVRCFDAIIPNDNFISQSFRHHRSVVIYNFPTLDFFRGVSDSAWDSREFDLFYHGSLPRYHVERMMAIAGQLKSVGVVTKWGIATNDEPTVQWAKQELRKSRLAESFEFLPYTGYLSVVAYLNRAKMGIIPLPPFEKFMKNIPLKLFEFMGCGLPVVLSDLPPSRQFIEGRDCAIAVEPDNIEEYVRAIMTLLDNPKRAAQMGKNGIGLILEKYNWGAEEAKLWALYQGLS